MLKLIPGLSLLFFILFCSGCWKQAPDGFPDVVPCKITIVKDNVPLPQVTIILVSDGSKPWFASGETDASGVAVIHTSLGTFSKSGAPEGKYKVTLNQIPQIQEQKSQQELFDMSPTEKKAFKEKIDRLIKESRSFPLEFESYLTTPLVIEITKSTPSLTLDVDKPGH